MRRHDDGRRALLLLEDLPHPPAVRRIEPGGGLVEEHHLGVPDERHRQRQPPPLAAGQAARLVLPLPQQVELPQPPLRLPVALVRREPLHPPVQVHVLPARELRVEHVKLRAHPEAPAELRPLPDHVQAPHHGPPLVGVERPRQERHGRRLPRPVVPCRPR